MKKSFSVVIAFALTAFLPTLSWAAAGAVVSSGGQATLERGGKMYRVVQKSAVESGDTLRTGDNGFIYFKMKNGEEIFLRPGTEFKVDTYTPPSSPAAPATGKSFYSLVKGTFRAITHSLGQRDESSYRVSTPVATMGIRGSDIVGSFDGQTLNFGVESGGGFVKSNGTTLNLDAQQFSTTSAGGQPQLLNLRPASLNGPWTFEEAVVVNQSGAGSGGAGASASAGATGVSTTTLVIGGIAVVSGIALIAGGDDSDSSGPVTTNTNK